MSAEVITLRALVVRDCAATARRYGLRCVARVIAGTEAAWDRPETAAVLLDAAADLKAAKDYDPLAASKALEALAGGDLDAAVHALANTEGMARAKWIETACRELAVVCIDREVSQ